MSNFFREFKEFAVKGNVIDLAVGVIIGGAFGKIVSSLVADIIMPPLGYIIGGIDFKDLGVVLKQSADGKALVTLTYGNFIQNIFDFVIIAFAIFLFVKTVTMVRKKMEKEKPAAPAAPSQQEILLTEIRDELRALVKK